MYGRALGAPLVGGGVLAATGAGFGRNGVLVLVALAAVLVGAGFLVRRRATRRR